MQKTNKKASILIWSVFLSLIISTTFLSINTKIKKNLGFNYELQNKTNIENYLNKAQKNNDYNDIHINNTTLKFQDLHKTSLTLTQYGTWRINYPNNSNLRINITWSPIFFETDTASGVIESNSNISSHSGSILFSNLGWISLVKIHSNNNRLSNTIDYSVSKKIGPHEKLIEKGTIKIF